MFKKIIINYIKNITIEDVLNFGKENSIILSNEEAVIILNHIKNDYEVLLYGDPTLIFNQLSNEIGLEQSKKVEELFSYFKNKYKFYL